MGLWHPTPVLLPGKSHGQRSLVVYSPWGRKESDTTERLHFISLYFKQWEPGAGWLGALETQNGSFTSWHIVSSFRAGGVYLFTFRSSRITLFVWLALQSHLLTGWVKDSVDHTDKGLAWGHFSWSVKYAMWNSGQIQCPCILSS